MAEKKSSASSESQYVTTYTTEQAPKLPDANVSTTRAEPVIDTRLIEARNAEAKRNADRVNQ
jgi:hypothetical protein